MKFFGWFYDRFQVGTPRPEAPKEDEDVGAGESGDTATTVETQYAYGEWRACGCGTGCKKCVSGWEDTTEASKRCDYDPLCKCGWRNYDGPHDWRRK